MAAKNPGMEDRGVFDFTDGGRYIGEWKENGANGHGVCFGPSGSGVFEGRWENGIQSSGVFTWSNGQQYKGTWKDGMRHGVGKEVRPDGTEYCGDFHMNIRGPYGVLKLSNGALYQGTWEDGLQDGVGVEVYADKGVYKGQYKKGLRSGYGTRSSSTYEKTQTIKDSYNSRRTGSVKAPKSLESIGQSMHHTISDSDIKSLSNKSIRSHSTVSSPSPSDPSAQIYEGQWLRDKRQGHGILKVPGVYIYCGEWSSNTRTGHGVLIYSDGQREEGYWEEGRLTVPLKRKKLSLKQHQLESKVKQAHTQALQAADVARTKSILAESRGSAAASRAKLGLEASETAQKEADIAKEISFLLNDSVHETKDILSPVHEMNFFPFKEVKDDEVPKSQSLLSIPSISSTPSFENLQTISPKQKQRSSSDTSDIEFVVDDTDCNMNANCVNGIESQFQSTPKLRKQDCLFSSDLHSSDSDSDITTPTDSKLKSLSLDDKTDFIKEGVTKRHRNQKQSIPRVDKSTGEIVTGSPDATDDEQLDETTPTNNVKFPGSKHQQVLNMDVLTQMANWNKTIAYINFILLLFLLVLIVFVVAFLSTTISQNNPAHFMTHMA